ncbi:MAG: hypothetical protein ABI151_11065 [Chitinophagaceae bacterium]
MKNISFYTLLILVIVSCNNESKQVSDKPAPPADATWVKAEGKDSLLLLTDRPPNLETPLKYFLKDYTPNSVFFVRWHLAGLPAAVNADTFRLRVGGNVNREIALSINDLKT